jgi:hypothetical protein
MGLGETLVTTLMVALIAALTVGGKSIGKGFAISKSTTILLVAGKLIYSWEILLARLRPAEKKQKRSKA